MNTETLQRTAPQAAPATTPASDSTDSHSVTESVRSTSDSIKEAAGEQVRQVAGAIRDGGREALDAAEGAGVGLVTQQKERFAAKIDEYTCAMKAACESLKTNSGNPLAAPAQRASRQLERAAHYLRNKEPMDLVDDLGAFARSRPEIVYGGMFVAGLAAVRLLKASSRGRNTRRNSESEQARTVDPQPASHQAPSDFLP